MFNYKEFFDNSNLNYQVETFPVKNPYTGEDTKYYGTVNTNNKKVLASGFTTYKTIQNSEAFKVLEHIYTYFPEMSITNSHMFDQGAIAAITVNIGTDTVSTNDILNKTLTICNSHNGSSPVHISTGYFRLNCKNQLHTIKKNSFATFTHTKTGIFKYDLQAVGKILHNFNINFNENIKIFKQLSNTKITKEHVLASIAELLIKNKKEVSKRSSTVIKNTTKNIINRFNTPDNGITPNDTAWNLYNAIQGTFQHQPNKKSKDIDKSVLLGTIKKQSIEALYVVQDVIQKPVDYYQNFIIDEEIREMIGDSILI